MEKNRLFDEVRGIVDALPGYVMLRIAELTDDPAVKEHFRVQGARRTAIDLLRADLGLGENDAKPMSSSLNDMDIKGFLAFVLGLRDKGHVKSSLAAFQSALYTLAKHRDSRKLDGWLVEMNSATKRIFDDLDIDYVGSDDHGIAALALVTGIPAEELRRKLVATDAAAEPRAPGDGIEVGCSASNTEQ